MRTVFLAWQDPSTRAWFPIGRLTEEQGVYQFAYLEGAKRAGEDASFQGLSAFPDVERVYESDELFPLFANRLPRPTRPEYADFVQWLNLPADEADPVALLARSGGRRATDSLEVFPCPVPDEEGNYHIHFLVHGLRHLPESSIERANSLHPGERLLLLHDLQNPTDCDALMLRTGADQERDEHIVGYCPRYLASDLHGVLENGAALRVQVERVNPPPAPLQLRILCSLTARWPADFRPFSSELYRPISDVVSVNHAA